MAATAARVARAMTQTSQTGTESGGRKTTSGPVLRHGGFTLVELLIVLTLLVTLTAVLSPMLLPSPARELRAAAGEIATTLRETRRHAQADQQRQRFIMDTQTGQYGIERTASWRTLPEDIRAELTTSKSLVSGQERGAIDFFPNGSSTGGRVRLGMADRSIRVDIEWLTGRIRIAETDP